MRITVMALATLLALALIACSSDDGSEPAEAGGAPASPQQSTTDEAPAEAKVSQTLDAAIEVTSPVFNRIRRIPKTYVCPGNAPVAGTVVRAEPREVHRPGKRLAADRLDRHS